MKVRIRKFSDEQDLAEVDCQAVHFGHLGMDAPTVMYMMEINGMLTVFVGDDAKARVLKKRDLVTNEDLLPEVVLERLVKK